MRGRRGLARLGNVCTAAPQSAGGIINLFPFVQQFNCWTNFLTKENKMQSQNPPAQIPEQFASVYGLGTPLGVYPTGAVNRWVSAILGVILIGAGALVALYGVYDTMMQVAKYGPVMFSKTITFPLIIAALLLLVGVLAAVTAFQNWNKAVVAYEKGLAYYDNKGLQTWGWHEVERFYIAITKHYTNGIYTSTTHLYTLQKADGSRLKLDDKLKKIEALGQLTGQKVASYQYDRLLQMLRSGQTVQLGPVALSKESISVSKKNYTWDEVEQIGIQKGYLSVKKKGGGWFSGASAPVSAIPNLDALFAVVNQVVKVKTG
jgi:hypothetical protein